MPLVRLTATCVFMWEWLEDELLFNSVLNSKAVIALPPPFCVSDCSQMLFSGWNGRQTSFFRGLGEKTNKAHSVCLKFTPHHFPLALLPWGVSKNQPPDSLVVSAALCLHYGWLYCWPLCPYMLIGWRTIKQYSWVISWSLLERNVSQTKYFQ